MIGDYKVYRGKVTIKTTVEGAGPHTLAIKIQACSKKACLLPATLKVTAPWRRTLRVDLFQGLGRRLLHRAVVVFRAATARGTAAEAGGPMRPAQRRRTRAGCGPGRTGRR